MPDYGYPDELLGPGPTQAETLANAIRQRRAAGTLASLFGAMSGNAGMQKFGAGQEQQAHQAEQLGLQKQHYDVQAAQMADLMRHRQALEALGQQRVGLQADLGQQRIDAMNRALALRGVRYNPNTGEFENIAGKAGAAPRSLLPKATGAGGADAAPAPAPTQFPRLGGKMLDKALKDLGADFDPTAKGGGEFAANQKRYNAGLRILALGRDANGNVIDLNPQQMPELAQSVATMIANGGQATQAQIEHLLPKSYTRDLAGITQYLTSEPHGAGQQAFVKNMLDTAEREMGVAKQGIESVRGQRVQKHQRVLRGNPDEARKVLEGFGWGFDPEGNPALKEAPKKAEAAGPPVAGAIRTKSGKWAVKNAQGQYEYVEGQ